jgi:hypothetical protein
MPVIVGQPTIDEPLRQRAAALLQHTYRWLEAGLPDAPQLSAAVPAVVTAVQLYEARSTRHASGRPPR